MTNKEMINKLRDMADCADASYAMLHYITDNEKDEFYDSWFNTQKWKEADNIKLGDKIKEGDKYIINNQQIVINSNTAYARAIESRFKKDVIVKKGIIFNDKLGDSPKFVSPTANLSLRTINFTNRYEILLHQPNTSSGFSATLFYDTQNQEYIVAFRGTEGFFKGKYCA